MREYSFTFKERDYTLKYDFNAICAIEEALDMSVQQMLDQKRIGLNTIRALVYGGMLHRNKAFTMDRAGLLLQDISEHDRPLINEIGSKAIIALVYAITPNKEAQKQIDEELIELEDNSKN